MKILDKYIAKNFIFGYIIAFAVMMGLLIVTDLFINLDEFAESSDQGMTVVISNMLKYYGAQSSIYFRDLAGFIIIVAAVFSLSKMTTNNELTAVMASGTSLRRVIAPIVILSVFLTGLLVVDQQLIIPKLANLLVRSHDNIQGGESYDIQFMPDSKGSLISTMRFEEKSDVNPEEKPGKMNQVAIVLRTKDQQKGIWQVQGWIRAKQAVYNEQKKGWDLENGQIRMIGRDIETIVKNKVSAPIDFYASDLTPTEIPLKHQEGYKALLSSAQLNTLVNQGTRVKDRAELLLQKHTRITEPLINLVMLLIALPVLVCRDPKAMKTAIMKSFCLTGACFTITFLCKTLATDVAIMGSIKTEFWAWLPIAIFLPLSLIELDSMKT